MQIIASAEGHIDAPARRVYHYIRDFREHHPRFLPPQFSDLQIETGGVGAGTVHSFNMTLGGTNGVQGFVERLVAPRMLRRVHLAELALLDRYARAAVPDTRPGVPAGAGVISMV